MTQAILFILAYAAVGVFLAASLRQSECIQGRQMPLGLFVYCAAIWPAVYVMVVRECLRHRQ
jgi:hypothetical protein